MLQKIVLSIDDCEMAIPDKKQGMIEKYQRRPHALDVSRVKSS